MSNQKDIIGSPEREDILSIVKELQEKRQQTRNPRTVFLDYLHGRMGALSIHEKAITVNYCEKLDEAFPAIAQALIIAVEALEKVENTYEHNELCPVYLGSGGCNCSVGPVLDALHRIRSLPTQ